MKKEIFLSCWISVVAGGCLSLQGNVEDGASTEPTPMFLHALELEPGCYVTPPVAAADPSATPDMLSAARQMQDLNVQYNAQFVALVVERVLEDASAPAWSFTYEMPGPITMVQSVEPTRREPEASEFVLTTTRKGFEQVDPSGLQQYVERTMVARGHADLHQSTLDLEGTSYRWNDNSFEVRYLGISRSVGDDGQPTWRQALLSFLRGCDPVTGVSFEATASTELRCWSRDRQPVSCIGLDLWR
ncbi:MAG: hypothetical protein HY903_11915 [Deltaproteobacteria bacterium]|nr:hypothetical protein [Deltaproteobacteria bacterium]